MENETVSVSIEADTSAFQTQMERLQTIAGSFGSILTSGLRSAAVSGKELDDVLRQIGLNIAGMALNRGLAPLGNMFNSMFSGLFGGITGFAKGGVPGKVVPFASGGVVSSPSYFPMGGGLGLMGEAGSEAIMPLQRTADGRLGVASNGGAAPMNVVFNVNAQDASSFRKSESQITGMLARAVRRGARSL
ncbi:MAG: phage tail tape measure protein [Rhizobiaceae bacterium]|nr:phage tail tape measure protein [Rhizobiaceae bacterium]